MLSVPNESLNWLLDDMVLVAESLLDNVLLFAISESVYLWMMWVCTVLCVVCPHCAVWWMCCVSYSVVCTPRPIKSTSIATSIITKARNFLLLRERRS